MPRFTEISANIEQVIAQHIQLYLEHPEQAHMWDASPMGNPGLVATLLLTTKGRKSGQERHVPLMYLDDNGNYLVIASKGGHIKDPAWYLNLKADPMCEIRVGKLHTSAHARTLEGEEREVAWSRLTAKHPAYSRYQSRTPRLIPVVRLEPTVA